MEKANTRGTTGATSVVVALESVSEMAANITAGQLRRRMSQSCAITAFASQRRWLQSGSWTGRSGLATSAVAYRAGSLPDAIPVEACYLGWQDSLRNLASLVEPKSINRRRMG